MARCNKMGTFPKTEKGDRPLFSGLSLRGQALPSRNTTFIPFNYRTSLD